MAPSTPLRPASSPMSIRPTSSRPRKDASRFDGNGTSKYEFGGTTLQFGRQPSFNEKYNPDYLYDPLRR